MLSIGVDNNLKKASDDEIEEIRDVLKKPHIRRQGQVIVTYDRVYRALDKAFDDHSDQKPILFQSETIDRTSLIYFNTDQEVGLMLNVSDLCLQMLDFLILYSILIPRSNSHSYDSGFRAQGFYTKNTIRPIKKFYLF